MPRGTHSGRGRNGGSSSAVACVESVDKRFVNCDFYASGKGLNWLNFFAA